MPKAWKVAASQLHNTQTANTLPLLPALAGVLNHAEMANAGQESSLETAAKPQESIAPALPHTASPSLKGAVLIWLQTITRALNADCRTDKLCLVSSQDAHERVHALLHVLRL